ncbi:MAG TPA: hypothetical protein VJN88_07520 [Ktedonobacterales bacterium]|nr:hypothetical protein [Ktedonobacterales bacterium]
MKALKRVHIAILATIVALLAGGTLAFANGFIGGNGASDGAHGAVVSKDSGKGQTSAEPTKGTETQQQQQTTSSEPTKGTEPTATTAPSVWAGKIAKVNCEGGSLTITLDSTGASATATLTGNTHYNVGSCGALKQGAHVTVEVQSGNAVNVTQDDSGSGGGTGGGTGDSTPTPGASK